LLICKKSQYNLNKITIEVVMPVNYDKQELNKTNKQQIVYSRINNKQDE
jgi:hypothetical protein